MGAATPPTPSPFTTVAATTTAFARKLASKYYFTRRFNCNFCMPHNNHNNAASNNCFIKRKIRERQRTMVRRCQTEFHMRVEQSEQGCRWVRRSVCCFMRMIFYQAKVIKQKKRTRKRIISFRTTPSPYPPDLISCLLREEREGGGGDLRF